MEVSAFFVTAVFLLGASVGGLFVSLQRQCTIERIRNEFERELNLTVRGSAKSVADKRKTVPESVNTTEPQFDAPPEEVADEEVFWDHLPVGQSETKQPHTHF